MYIPETNKNLGDKYADIIQKWDCSIYTLLYWLWLPYTLATVQCTCLNVGILHLVCHNKQ